MLDASAFLLDIDGKVPLIFGSIGHRDCIPEDLASGAEKIKEVLKGYRQRFTDTPFIFICPLAEGADITAAEAAISIHDPFLHLLPILPFEAIRYRETISQEWQSRFDRLMSQPRRLPEIIVSDETAANHVSIERMYQKAGEFVAINSHVLFALKDNWGTKERFVGGTADIIHFRRNGCTNPHDLSISNIRCAEEGYLYEIRVRRTQHPHEDLEIDYCYSTPRHERHNLESKINANPIVKDSNRIGKSWLKNLLETILDQQSHLHDPDLIAFETNALNKALNNEELILEGAHSHINHSSLHAKRLDNIASSLKNTYTKFHLYPAFVIAILIALLETFDSFVGETNIELLGGIPLEHVTKIIKFTLISSLFIIGISELINRYKHRFESTRAAAEAMKVQGYWVDLGIKESAADYLLAAQIGDSSWVRRTARSVAVLDTPLAQANQSMSAERMMKNIHSIQRGWIADQITFFEDRIKGFENKLHILRKIAYLCLFLGISSYILSHEFIAKYLHAHLELGNFYLLFFLLFGLAKGFTEIQAYEVLVKRYTASKHIFEQVDRVYQELLKDKAPMAPETMKRFRDLFQMLGVSVLEENSDWYVMNSRLKFKSPQGG
ncbi:hypothetical protein [Polynucleobacter sp. JS-Polo-80-F4]|uniref:hypothetical protein n=1 Tax=Polynucleobacter sp. JS-Polo-80-F4 TaxID=2576918 RepID=UPI001C0E4CF9|nr:hypothetical protein [Polynucleobacter sp. JS-Polo-80-F4]MBU3617277.1 hypothetical protein [Polynucleobacter sp. JS-Polo-80-F4]